MKVFVNCSRLGEVFEFEWEGPGSYADLIGLHKASKFLGTGFEFHSFKDMIDMANWLVKNQNLVDLRNESHYMRRVGDSTVHLIVRKD